MRPVLRPATLALLASVLTTGCSSFDRAWRKVPIQSAGVAGRWEGQWKSDAGHRGRLRAIITPQTDRRYHARFRATYASVLSAEYKVDLDVKRRPGRSEFDGAADLGVWGRYETTGYATDTRFYATYRSKFDRGTFEMLRRGESNNTR